MISVQEDAMRPYEVIARPYLMVTFIPCFVDGEGAIWLEQAWHHDLIAHLEYLVDFILCAPKISKKGQRRLVRLVIPQGVRFRYVELPARATTLRAIANLPRTMLVLWKVIGQSEIVHSSVIGWPYPLGWIVNPFSVIRCKTLVLVVESSWRSGSHSLLRRAFDEAKELMARWSCRHSAAVFFTQPTYRELLYSGSPGRDYVTPAVWINEADTLQEADALRSWERKDMLPVRLLFAGRLVASKGVLVLLQALRILEKRKVDVIVDIIGEGDLREECLRASVELSLVQLTLLEPVPYGESFFQLIQRYHALLVPSLSDEQPRVVFDANGQAVPVIASDTAGLRPHVADDRTGWLVEPGNAEALAAVIAKAVADVTRLRSMGMASLSATRGHTHVAMHRQRSRILGQLVARS